MKFFKGVLYYLAIFLLTAVVIISRRPSSITNPQFFAEDGMFWFAQAYNLGPVQPFLIPVAGYFQTFSRVCGLLAQAAPLQRAPLVFNLLAISVMALPVVLLLSNRFDRLIPDVRARLGMCLAYLLLSNTGETYINVTNAQWYLGLVAVMVLVADEPAKFAEKTAIKLSLVFWTWFDQVVLFLSGLTGPFAIFLLPVAAGMYRTRKTVTTKINLGIVGATGALQLLALLTSGRGDRLIRWYEVSWQPLWEVWYRQVVWGLLVGPNGYLSIVSKMPKYEAFFFITTFMSLVVVGYAMTKAKLELRLAGLYAGLILLASVMFPTVSAPAGLTRWQVLAQAYGIRYWLIPMLVWLAILVWSLKKTNPRPIRFISAFFLLSMVLFTIRNYSRPTNYRYPGYADFDYTGEVEIFLTLPKGTPKKFVYPPSPWQMELIKK